MHRHTRSVLVVEVGEVVGVRERAACGRGTAGSGSMDASCHGVLTTEGVRIGIGATGSGDSSDCAHTTGCSCDTSCRCAGGSAMMPALSRNRMTGSGKEVIGIIWIIC
jgi:hypothetical protein